MKNLSLVKKVSSVALALATITISVFAATAAPVAATGAKLELTNTVDKQQADRGETLSYTLTVKNTGSVDTTTTFLWINEPNLVDYVAGSSNYTRSTNGINRNLTDAWIKDGVNFGTVPAGTTVVLKYQTKVAQNANHDDVLWSVASIKSDQTSQKQANSWTRVILKNPAICAEKTADKTSVSVGDTVTFSIKVCNKGNIVLHNVRIGDIIHQPLNYVAGSSTVVFGSTVTKIEDSWLTDGLNVGSLNPGQEKVLKFKVTVGNDLKDGQVIQNVAQVKSDETPNILQCSVILKGKVLGTTTPTPETPTELPDTGPGEVLLLISGLIPAGVAIKKFKTKI